MGRGGRRFPRKRKEGESAGRYWVRLLSPFFAKEANLTLRREGGRLRVGLQQARGPSSSSSSPFPLRVIGGGGGSAGQKKGFVGMGGCLRIFGGMGSPTGRCCCFQKEGREGGRHRAVRKWSFMSGFFYREGVRERGRS